MLKIIRLPNKPASNKNNNNKSVSSKNNNNKSIFRKNNSNSKVNGFDISWNNIKHAKKLRKLKSKKIFKS